MATLADIHHRGARLYPDAPALVWEGGTRSYAAQRRHVVALAAGLAQLGLKPGDRVAVLAKNGPEQATAFGACEVSGMIAVSVNFRLGPVEIAHVLSDSGAACLIFEDEFAPVIGGLRGEGFGHLTFVCAGDAPDWATPLETVQASGEGRALTASPSPDDIAFLIYTSGTTGRAKGVMLDHASQVALAEEVVAAGGVRQDDSVLLVMPLYHIGAKSKQLGYALAGGTVHLHRQFDPDCVLAALADEEITATHLAPIMVQMLMEAHGRDPRPLPRLKNLYYASAAMPVDTLRRAMAAFGPVMVQFYGLTETGVSTVFQAHHHVLDGPDDVTERLGSAGQPTFRSDVKIATPEGETVPPRTRGEILLKGPTVMRGYWNLPEATAETIRDGWIRTGDIGWQDECGFLHIVDRIKDVIISGGENIYPREVEEILHRHPKVNQAAVIGVPDPKWGESVRAYVVPKPGSARTKPTSSPS